MKITTSLLSHPKYRPDIDGLRAVAILSVVIFHAFPSLVKGGFIGVDIFFVISGFLISTIIFESQDGGTFSFYEFYTRRIVRIFPALTVVLFFCLLFSWFSLLPDELNQLGKHVIAGVGFVSNLVLWSESGYFDNSADTKPLRHLWSLGIEEQFYIIWPLIISFWYKRHFNLLYLIYFFLVVSFFLNIWLVYQDPVATFYSPITRFWELLCGALLAWYRRYKSEFFIGTVISLKAYKIPLRFEKSDSDDQLVLLNKLSFIGAALLIIGFAVISKELNVPGYWAVLPVFGTVLIIAAGPNAWLNRKILSNKFLVWFGLISFPLYLWHWPILSFGRIVYFDNPPLKFRVFGVLTSILLAWFTMKFIESPLRFGGRNSLFKVGILSGVLICLGLVGIIIFSSNFSESHSFDKLKVKRVGEHAIGSSLAWYQGKDHWLFLGNNYDKSVAKLKLAITPSEIQVNEVKESFSKISEAGAKFGIKTVLIVGPNKSSIYPEFLPNEIIPSETKYSSFFLNKLIEIPNLVVCDPTYDFLEAKKSEGLLYWKTDTHWNNKGAFLAYVCFSRLLNLPIPNVDFKQGSIYSGDMIDIAGLKNFPLNSQDNWDIIWKEKPVWTEQVIPNELKTTFGIPSLVTNEKFISNSYIWVVGDSFAGGLKQYFNATFKQVRYVGHWRQKFSTLTDELDKAQIKPDLIVIVRVERSF